MKGPEKQPSLAMPGASRYNRYRNFNAQEVGQMVELAKTQFLTQMRKMSFQRQLNNLAQQTKCQNQQADEDLAIACIRLER